MQFIKRIIFALICSTISLTFAWLVYEIGETDFPIWLTLWLGIVCLVICVLSGWISFFAFTDDFEEWLNEFS